jgi:hypothetical protein
VIDIDAEILILRRHPRNHSQPHSFQKILTEIEVEPEFSTDC